MFRENILNSKHSRRIKTVSEHLKKINPVLFRIFSDSNELPLLSNNDLVKLSEKNYYIIDDYYYIKKILHYHKLLYKTGAILLPLDMLKEYSEGLEELFYYNPYWANKLEFPSPPFTGNSYIRPLKTVTDIYDWAD